MNKYHRINLVTVVYIVTVCTARTFLDRCGEQKEGVVIDQLLVRGYPVGPLSQGRSMMQEGLLGMDALFNLP